VRPNGLMPILPVDVSKANASSTIEGAAYERSALVSHCKKLQTADPEKMLVEGINRRDPDRQSRLRTKLRADNSARGRSVTVWKSATTCER
jgi:hypothetical protein